MSTDLDIGPRLPREQVGNELQRLLLDTRLAVGRKVEPRLVPRVEREGQDTGTTLCSHF